MATINIVIEEDLKRRLQEEATELSKKLGVKVTLSEYVRMLIKKSL